MTQNNINIDNQLEHTIFCQDTHFLAADPARLRALHIDVITSPVYPDFMRALETFQHIQQTNDYLYCDPLARCFIYHPFVMTLAEMAPINPDRSIVLYSSRPAKNKMAAQQYVLDHPESQIIDNTVAGWMLDKLQLFDQIPDTELAYLPWFVLSKRFCTETKSPNAIAFYHDSDSTSTFRMIEIEAMLDNPHIKRVNGQPKVNLIPEISDDYTAYLVGNPSLFGQKLADYRANSGEKGLKSDYIPMFRQPI